jgi:hypothetical protein
LIRHLVFARARHDVALATGHATPQGCGGYRPMWMGERVSDKTEKIRRKPLDISAPIATAAARAIASP